MKPSVARIILQKNNNQAESGFSVGFVQQPEPAVLANHESIKEVMVITGIALSSCAATLIIGVINEFTVKALRQYNSLLNI